jgi:hypothetical protein
MNEDEFDLAIDMLERGDVYSGNILLEKILKQGQIDEIAWLKLAEITENDVQKITYLENALKINPANQKTMEELIIMLSKDNPRYMNYFEEVGQEIHNLSLGQFLFHYKTAISTKKDITFKVIFDLSGVSESFGGYAVVEETHFRCKNGELELFETGVRT